MGVGGRSARVGPVGRQRGSGGLPLVLLLNFFIPLMVTYTTLCLGGITPFNSHSVLI